MMSFFFAFTRKQDWQLFDESSTRRGMMATMFTGWKKGWFFTSLATFLFSAPTEISTSIISSNNWINHRRSTKSILADEQPDECNLCAPIKVAIDIKIDLRFRLMSEDKNPSYKMILRYAANYEYQFVNIKYCALNWLMCSPRASLTILLIHNSAFQRLDIITFPRADFTFCQGAQRSKKVQQEKQKLSASRAQGASLTHTER